MWVSVAAYGELVLLLNIYGIFKVRWFFFCLFQEYNAASEHNITNEFYIQK